MRAHPYIWIRKLEEDTSTDLRVTVHVTVRVTSVGA